MNKATHISTCMHKVYITKNLHQGVKIGKMYGQVTKILKAAIFWQGWHLYYIKQAISNKKMNIKVVYHDVMNTKK